MLTKMASLRIMLVAAFAVFIVQSSRSQALSLPALDPESLPSTNFSCKGKVIGGYYADIYTGCQMFHVCTLDEKGEIHDYKFGCIPGTVFDQETRVCERSDEVDCSISESFFYLNNELYGPGLIPPTAIHRVSDEATGGTDFSTTTTRPAFVFPVTSFSCHDKISGGLYADTETGCAVFHICSVGPDSSIIDNKFVCGEGTLFDQKSRTCQAASAVDCSLSESLYYLNDRLKGPEKFLDLCLIQPLGTPLANLTSGCQNYIVCENVSDDRAAERHHTCKKGYLFSQMRKMCLPQNKVKCVKETLSGILQMNSPKKGITYKKSRLTRSLLQHRLRRAALPPIANAVANAGMEDARVRRALFSLSALQRWASENSRDTTFIEVYSLNTNDGQYPKKTYGETSQATRYGYILRRKRNVVNVTSAEQALVSNKTKSEEAPLVPALVASTSNQEREDSEATHQGLAINPTTTIPVNNSTITISPKNGVLIPALSKQTVLPRTNSITPSLNPSPTKIVKTLTTFTLSNTAPHTTTVTNTATVTVTNTVTIGDNPIVNNAVPTSQATRYEYILRKKRDVVNVTSAEQALVSNKTKSEEAPSVPALVASTSNQEREDNEATHQGLAINPTTTIPVNISTITIPPKNGVSIPALSKQTVLPRTNSITPSLNPSPTKIVGTLTTFTISNTAPRTTTVTNTATVTVTNTVTIGVNNEDNPVVNTEVPTLPGASEVQPVSSSIPSNTVTSVNLVGNTTRATDNTTFSTFNVTEGAVENSNSAPVSSPLGETAGNATLSDLASSEQNKTAEELAAVSPSNDAESSDSAVSSTAVPATTPLQLDSAVTEASVENENSTIASNISTSSTAASTTGVTPPEGSITASTTVLPGDSDSSSNSSTVVTHAPAPTVGPITRDNVPDTNFTCKDKKLEQFYPDTEANCQVFHYCSPGFADTQILDLKFLCTGFTMFDVNTQKCENMTNVTCGEPPETTIPSNDSLTTTPVPESVITTQKCENTTNITCTELIEATTVPSNESLTTTAVPESVITTQKCENATNVTCTELTETTTMPSNESLITASVSKPVVTLQKCENETNVTCGENTETTTMPVNDSLITTSVPEPENPSLTTTESDDIAYTSTVENILDEVVTELYSEDTEVVTERLAREEIPRSTVSTQEEYTTEVTAADELNKTMELGPFSEPNENAFEAVTESESADEMDVPIQASTESVPSQISSTSNPLPTLNDTDISSTVMNNSSTKASESTHIETP